VLVEGWSLDQASTGPFVLATLPNLLAALAAVAPSATAFRLLRAGSQHRQAASQSSIASYIQVAIPLYFISFPPFKVLFPTPEEAKGGGWRLGVGVDPRGRLQADTLWPVIHLSLEVLARACAWPSPVRSRRPGPARSWAQRSSPMFSIDIPC